MKTAMVKAWRLVLCGIGVLSGIIGVRQLFINAVAIGGMISRHTEIDPAKVAGRLTADIIFLVLSLLILRYAFKTNQKNQGTWGRFPADQRLPANPTAVNEEKI